ncbi:hypothetical protein ACFQH6_19795 [Halobacteriaceae archaeon GCM10025711]
MSSTTSISFRMRDDADEIFEFPIITDPVTFGRRNSVVMVSYTENGTVLVIAGKIPGMNGYYKNYPEVVKGDPQKIKEHQFSRNLLEKVLKELSEYNPETSTAESNSGNRTLSDIYVEVDEEKRDEAVLAMWRVLHRLREEHLEFLKNSDSDEPVEYESLADEVLRITSEFD